MLYDSVHKKYLKKRHLLGIYNKTPTDHKILIEEAIYKPIHIYY